MAMNGILDIAGGSNKATEKQHTVLRFSSVLYGN